MDKNNQKWGSPKDDSIEPDTAYNSFTSKNQKNMEISDDENESHGSEQLDEMFDRMILNSSALALNAGKKDNKYQSAQMDNIASITENKAISKKNEPHKASPLNDPASVNANTRVQIKEKSMKFKEQWQQVDKTCPTCGQVTIPAKGLTKQNIRRLISPKAIFEPQNLTITILMIIALFLAAQNYMVVNSYNNLLLNMSDVSKGYGDKQDYYGQCAQRVNGICVPALYTPTIVNSTSNKTNP